MISHNIQTQHVRRSSFHVQLLLFFGLLFPIEFSEASADAHSMRLVHYGVMRSVVERSCDKLLPARHSQPTPSQLLILFNLPDCRKCLVNDPLVSSPSSDAPADTASQFLDTFWKRPPDKETQRFISRQSHRAQNLFATKTYLKNFSMSTLPRKPVPPVMKMDRFAYILRTLSSSMSSIVWLLFVVILNYARNCDILLKAQRECEKKNNKMMKRNKRETNIKLSVSVSGISADNY